MDENLHDIEELFFSNLDDNKEVPPPSIWNNVHLHLEQDASHRLKKKYANLKRGTALLLILLSGLVVVDIYDASPKNKVSKKISQLWNSNKTVEKEIAKVVPGPTKKNDFLQSTTIQDLNKEKSLIIIPKTINEGKIRNQKTSSNLSSLISGAQNSTKENDRSLIDIRRSGPVLSKVENLISDKKKQLSGKNSKINKQPSSSLNENQVPTVEGDLVCAKGSVEQVVQQFPELVRIFKKDSITTRAASPATKIPVSKNTESMAATTIKITAGSKHYKPSFFITPFASIDFAWYRLQDDKFDNHTHSAHELENEETHDLSGTFGAVADYRFSNHWGLQSGVNFAIINITVDPQTIYAQHDNNGSVKFRINTTSGYGFVLPSFNSSPSIGDSLRTTNSVHSLQYIGIPLAINYNCSLGKFDFNFLAGVSANILVKAKLETIVASGSRNSIETLDNLEGLKKNYFSGLAGFGSNYNLSNKLALSMVPTIRFALSSINKDAPVKSYPMSLGFAGGIKIKL